MAIGRAGSKLVKGGIKGAKRLWDDLTDGSSSRPSATRVRAAKGTKGQPEGVGTSAKNRKTGAEQQNQPKAKGTRKVDMHNLTALDQPAGGTPGKTIDQADSGGIRNSQKAAKAASDFDKAIKETKKELAEQKELLKQLQKSLKAFGPGKNKPLRQRIKDLKQSIELNQEKLTGKKGMVTRGGPRVNKRKGGGQVMKKAGGGKMSHVGLYPAEEARSGTMSEKKRAKHMKHGGKVHRNTSRENRLEELGRVDAEKAHTKKGKRNLRAEKKRIVRELNGNEFVAQHYD